MYLKTFTLTLASSRPIRASASQLRGFFATKFNEYTLLHQHHTDRLIYRYPLVQYKIIDSTPTVIGINEGVEVLKEIYDQYDEINLNGSVYEIMERGISVRNQEFGLTDEMHHYPQPGELQTVLPRRRQGRTQRTAKQNPHRKHTFNVQITGLSGPGQDTLRDRCQDTQWQAERYQHYDIHRDLFGKFPHS